MAIINSSRLFVLGNHFDLQGNPFFLKISACDIIFSKIKQILSTRERRTVKFQNEYRNGQYYRRVAGQIGPKQNRPHSNRPQVKSAPDQIIVLLCFFYSI